jgi:hypothetical protein
MNAVCRGRADEAEAILKTVDAHPVKEYLAERLTALRAGPAEAAARSAWQRLEPRTHGTPSEARAKAVLAELETYLKEHGSTRFAASVAAAVAAAKSRCASAAGDVSGAALAAHWRFDEGKGAVASDSSGRNRHARITEGTWVRGKLGTALKLPGGASEVAPSGTDGLDMGGADFTICAWIRTTQQAGTIFSKSDPGGSWQPGGKIVYIAGGRLEFDAHSVGRVDSPAVLSDGVWHHIAVGYEFGPKTLRLYADGDLVARRHIALSADVPAHVFKMGHFPRPCFGSEPYAGEIDDARFYQRLLTAGELATLAGAAAAAAGPDAAAPVAVIRSGSTGAMQVFVDDVAIADRVLSAQEVASAAFGRPRPGASPNG